MTLSERLGKEWIFCDGGTGTLMQQMGLKGGELPESWNITHPDDIRMLARGYFDAGCNIVNANTFGANRLKFDNPEDIIRTGVRLCREARHEAGRDDDALSHFEEARRLHPDSWTIWRQTAERNEQGFAAGPDFWARVDALGERRYYPRPDIEGMP